MVIVAVSDAGTDSVEQYDQVIKQLEEAGHEPPGAAVTHGRTQGQRQLPRGRRLGVPRGSSTVRAGPHAADRGGRRRGTEPSDLAAPQHDQRSLGRGSR